MQVALRDHATQEVPGHAMHVGDSSTLAWLTDLMSLLTEFSIYKTAGPRFIHNSMLFHNLLSIMSG